MFFWNILVRIPCEIHVITCSSHVIPWIFTFYPMGFTSKCCMFFAHTLYTCEKHVKFMCLFCNIIKREQHSWNETQYFNHLEQTPVFTFINRFEHSWRETHTGGTLSVCCGDAVQTCLFLGLELIDLFASVPIDHDYTAPEDHKHTRRVQKQHNSSSLF